MRGGIYLLGIRLQFTNGAQSLRKAGHATACLSSAPNAHRHIVKSQNTVCVGRLMSVNAEKQMLPWQGRSFFGKATMPTGLREGFIAFRFFWFPNAFSILLLVLKPSC